VKLCHINGSGPFFETRIHGSKVETNIFEFRRFYAANHQGLSIRSHASGIDDDSSFSPDCFFLNSFLLSLLYTKIATVMRLSDI